MLLPPCVSTYRSTFEHPVCKTAVAYADKCCRDDDGNPWPPVPTDVPRDSYTIHELQPSDVKTLDELRLNRGLAFREGHYPPFPVSNWTASSVICARWDRSTDEGALREWLDHHRCGPAPSLLVLPACTDRPQRACELRSGTLITLFTPHTQGLEAAGLRSSWTPHDVAIAA